MYNFSITIHSLRSVSPKCCNYMGSSIKKQQIKENFSKTYSVLGLLIEEILSTTQRQHSVEKIVIKKPGRGTATNSIMTYSSQVFSVKMNKPEYRKSI